MLFCFLFITYSTKAQTLIGTVKNDKGELIEGVNILLLNHKTNKPLAFSVTDKLGIYYLNYSSIVDSVIISVNHLSYRKLEKIIDTNQNIFDFTLTEGSYSLPELRIYAKKVEIRGDTLAYDVSQLKLIDDITIEDVIKRIPGIEISSNGRINFEGLPISKFYVEGLDMLEGKYNIITKTLNLNAIRDIEILKNHQHIRALDSLETPENAAINLRLKDKVALTGASSLRLGMPIGLVGVNSDNFMFYKKLQSNFGASFNNLGENRSILLENLYVLENGNFFNKLNITYLIPPIQIKEEFFNRNNEKLLNFNLLTKVKSNTELKLQTGFVKDQMVVEGMNQFRFTLSNSPSPNFSDIVKNKMGVKNIHSKVILEQNSKLIYIKANTEYKISTNKNNGNNLIDNVLINELLCDNTHKIKSDLTTIIRSRNKAFKFYTKLNANFFNGVLKFNPWHNQNNLGVGLTIDTIIQKQDHYALNIQIETNKYKRNKRFISNYKIGIEYIDESNNSILGQDNHGTILSFGQDFEDKFYVKNLAPFIISSYKIPFRKSAFTINIPFNLNNLWFEDNKRFEKFQKSLLTYTPSLSTHLQISNFSRIAFEYKFESNYINSNSFGKAYVLRSYRNIEKNQNNLLSYKNNLFKISYSNTNTMKDFEFRLSYEMSNIINDFILNLDILSSNQSIDFARKSNIQKNHNLSATGKWYFYKDMSFIVASSFSQSSRDLFHSNKLFEAQLYSAYIKLTLSIPLNNSVIKLENDWQYRNSNFRMFTNHQNKSSIAYFIKIHKNMSIRFNNYLINNNFNSINQLFFLNDVYVNKVFKKNKINASISLLNLTNRKLFLSNYQSFLLEQQSSYELSGRRVLLKIEFTF